MSTSSRIPPRFIDPVTSELMVDPVVLKNGRTVDRATAGRTRELIMADNIDLRSNLFEQYPAQSRAYEQRRSGAVAPADHAGAVSAHLVNRLKHLVNRDSSTPWEAAPGEPPDHLCDPITTEIMNDPVVMSDGRTVDRETALSLKISPWTREEVHTVVDNVDLRDEIFVLYPNRAYKFVLVDPKVRGHVLWAMVGEENVHRLSLSKNDSYLGTIKNNLAHGVGVWTGRTGLSDRIYVGEMKYGLFDGQGAAVWANGDHHEGGYKNGEMHGQGTYTWPEGDRYEGNYENSKMHGQGIYTWADGARYEGGYENDKSHGQGVSTWPNGARHEGGYENDKRHGWGVQTWPNGVRHEGGYENDKRHGWGIQTWPNGKVLRGLWENDKIKFEDDKKTKPFWRRFSKISRS